MTTLQSLSSLDRDAFIAALDGIFEHSPWVAAAAWEKRPFGSFEALREALLRAMREAGHARQLALVRAHPELAGRASVRGELTAESSREQAGARLDACTPEEFARLQSLNSAYNAKFGFPFIMAVRGHDRQQIIERFSQRLTNAPEVEFVEALRQIERIATLRLTDLVQG